MRFDLAIRVMMPTARIITPIRELGAQRASEVEYLSARSFAVPEGAGRYSINKGLLGTTIGGGETLDSWEHPPDSAFVQGLASVVLSASCHDTSPYSARGSIFSVPPGSGRR